MRAGGLSTARPRRKAVVSLGIAVVLLGTVLQRGAVAQTPVPIGDADFSGYATGTNVHADALAAAGVDVVDAEVAFSGAAVDSVGLDTLIANEMGQTVVPKKDDKSAYARGTGLEAGLGVADPDPNQIVLAGFAEQDAPPNKPDVAVEEIAVDGDPLAFASVAKGLAHALWNQVGGQDACVLGDDISRGTGQAADVELVDAGGDDGDTLDSPVISLDQADDTEDVVESNSRTKLIPNGKGGFGLMTEVRMSTLPISLAQAGPNGPSALTIELAGEWVLRATATGLPGGAKITYAPDGSQPNATPVLNVLLDGVSQGSLLLQDLLGQTGLEIPIPGLAEIVIGEDPRAIGGDASSQPTESSNGTLASGAVDIARIILADGDLGDIRVGHMEVRAQVPVGGIQCEIPTTKTVDPESVIVGVENRDTFKATITVDNVFDCDLTGVVLEDKITTEPAENGDDPRFKITAAGGDATPTSPSIPTETLDETTVRWNLGTVAKGTRKRVTLDVQAIGGGPGDIVDIATATGKLANCTGGDEDVTGIGVAGVTMSGTSGQIRVPVTPREMPRTGAGPWASTFVGIGLLGLAGAGLALRRRFS